MDEAAWLHEQWGTSRPPRTCTLAAGRRHSHRRGPAGRRRGRPLRLDYFYDLTMAIRGLRAIALGDRALAADAYAALLPYEGRFTGASTAVGTVGPVAHILGDLARFLERAEEDAAAHYRRAADVAARLGAPSGPSRRPPPSTASAPPPRERACRGARPGGRQLTGDESGE